MDMKRYLNIILAIALVFGAFVGILPNAKNASAETESETIVTTVPATNALATGIKWSYLDNGTDPSPSTDRTSWTKVGFNDSAWKTASGAGVKFGSKAGLLQALDTAGNFMPTVLLNHYQSDNTCVPTYFFRYEFNLKTAPPSDGLAILGTIRYDDAAIVYINGTRVAAFDEPDGGFESNLSYGGSGAYDPVTATFTADTSLLQAGENVIAVELHQQRSDSSDIWFDMPFLGMQDYFIMNVGADETQRNFNWYFPSESGCIQYAVRNGDSFPENYSIVDTDATAYEDTYIHRATISDLAPNTKYVYRVVNGDAVSKNFYFETDGTDSFNFIYVGDPQIGASWGNKADASLWDTTLNTIQTMFPNTSLLVSAGDQVEVCTPNYEHLYHGFLMPSILPSFAVATSVGNHENDYYLESNVAYDSNGYNRHYNLPNTSTAGKTYGVSTTGSDYWYTYNNTLFMHINSNSNSMAEHKAFMQTAMEANPDVRWTVAVMHFSMYGAGSYYVNEIIANRRQLYAPMFDELDIDVVLSGHEHIYARSYMVKHAFNPDNSNGVLSSVVNPVGVLYLTASSSTGTKYYDMMDDASTPHIAAKAQHVTTFTNVEVTDRSFKLTTYRVDDKSVLDSFEIIKDETLPPEEDIPIYDYDVTDNLALGKPYTTSKPYRSGGADVQWAYDENAEISYPDEDGKTLTDGYLPATKAYKDSAWVGLHDQTPDAKEKGYSWVTVDLGGTHTLNKLAVYVTPELGDGVKLPSDVKAYGYDNTGYCFKIGEFTIPDNVDADARYVALEMNLDGVVADKIEIRLTRGGYTMISEVAAYGTEGGEYDQIGNVETDGMLFTLSEDGSYYILSDCAKTVTTVEIPATVKGLPVKVIAEYAFEGCTKLTSVTIPNGITTLENCAFTMCTKLQSINIPASVTDFHHNAFSLCGGIATITVASENPKYISKGNCLIEESTKTLVKGCKNSIIPTDGSVTSIGIMAFCNVFELKNIDIPDTVTKIGDFAFSDCTSLSRFVIPDSVTDIGKWAFSNCRALTQIVIPASVKTVGEHAFTWSSLTDIYCEAKSMPSGWNSKWVYECNASVHWGYDPDANPEPEYKKGDINMNGRLDARDYLLLKRAFFKTYTLQCTDEIADINDNGRLDARDYLLLKRAFFKTYEIK